MAAIYILNIFSTRGSAEPVRSVGERSPFPFFLRGRSARCESKGGGYCTTGGCASGPGLQSCVNAKMRALSKLRYSALLRWRYGEEKPAKQAGDGAACGVKVTAGRWLRTEF